MSSPRAVLVALVALTIAACSPGPATQPTAVTQATTPPDAATPVVTPEPSTEPPTPKPTPKPTPRPVPVPPQPTKVTFGEHQREIKEGEEYEITYTVTWRAPRTKGVEIRVYGVLGCLSRPENPPDSSSGPCLVENTRLPASARKLIAKAKASDGVINWTVDLSDPGCDMAEQVIGPHKETFYAIVLAAYNRSGPSVFAIADPGEWWTAALRDTPC